MGHKFKAIAILNINHCFPPIELKIKFTSFEFLQTQSASATSYGTHTHY